MNTNETKPLADNAPHILVIDDDRRIRDLLSRFLTENNFRISVASDAADARRKLTGLAFDLLIVDVMMPGESGVEFTQVLRQEMDVPILMLTALSETEARIKGLEAGADDYLPKPFDPRELLLRVSAILKRSVQPEIPAIEQVVFGPYTFTIASRELKNNGTLVRLTDREREIMVLFALNAGEIVPRQDLLGNDNSTGERTVDVQINRLRRKIEPDPAQPNWLQTVRGLGYKLYVD